MSIRLIASDMDGTLLNPHSAISKANIEAIRRLDRTDTEFLICSGRDYHDARAIIEPCDISCSYICLSGAAVYDKDGELLSEIPLTRQNIDDIVNILTSLHADMDILTSCGRYTTVSKDEKLKEVYSFLNGKNASPDSISDTDALFAAAMKRTDSMTFIGSIQEIPKEAVIFKICSNGLPSHKVAKLKEMFSRYPDLAAASSFPDNIELTNKAAQKGPALKAYAGLKGIPPEDIMVLGDSDNDLSMFTPEFGWTVAMDNAMPCIRDAARYHTKSNSEDGVAWAIRNYLFHEKM